MLLLFLLGFPLVGIFLLCLIPETEKKLLKIVSLIISLILFYFSLFLWIFFDKNSIFFQFFTSLKWFSFLNINLIFGIDSISLFFILLTTFLFPLCILVIWKQLNLYLKEFLILFLFLEFLLLIVFSVLDLLLFYIFFESILIPMFLIIGIWGARDRKIRAAYYFFLYTLVGSLIMLVSILIILFETGTTNLLILLSYDFSIERQLLLWIMFFASFAVKIPIVPFHLWLTEAHVEAPTVGSVILAGLLLKLGTYGFLRFSIPLFPYANFYYVPLMYTISIISVIYSSLTTIRQIDLKKIIAYSSVAHMNFTLLGLFSNTVQGIEGSLFLMISHGFVASALFLSIGILYDRYHTRLLKYYSGLTITMPLFSISFFIFSLANLGFPGTSSFIGELLIVIGSIQKNMTVTFLGAFGLIFGAIYSIWLFNRICFGNLKIQYIFCFVDISFREGLILLPLIFIIFFIGIYPNIILQTIHLDCFLLLN